VHVLVARTQPQRRAWADVADVAVRELPERPLSLPGRELPDLAFTTPRPSAKEGDPCDPSQRFIVVEWLFQVRNDGRGLAPKRVLVHVVNGFGSDPDERWSVGDRSWVRGLAPGEQTSLTPPDGSYSSMSYSDRVTIDPDNNVRESDETNNSLTLGLLPNLVCR